MSRRRLSRDSHPLLSGGGSAGDSPSPANEPPVFSSIAASRYFSAATTATGQVFTWGSGFSGELGFDGHSWVTVAREVDGVIREVRVARIMLRLGRATWLPASRAPWDNALKLLALLFGRRSRTTVAPARLSRAAAAFVPVSRLAAGPTPQHT